MSIKYGLTMFMIFCGPLLWAQSTPVAQSTESIEAEEQPPKKNWSAELKLELRAAEDLRRRPAQKTRQGVHELSAGGEWFFDSRTKAAVEVSIENLKEESTFFVKRAYLDWTSEPGWFRARLGQQFLPVGLVNERDNWFSSTPPFLQRLLTVDKAIDIGVLVALRPLSSDWIYIEAGQFAGRLTRESDGQNAAPEQAPTVFSLRSESPHHSAFVTKLDHDLAYRDAVHAWGLGGEWRSDLQRSFGARVLAEFWNFSERQAVGPEQRNRSWLIHAELRLWKFSMGQRYSESRGEIIGPSAPVQLALERSSLHFLDFAVASGVHFRVERVVEAQGEVTRDDLVGRAIAQAIW